MRILIILKGSVGDVTRGLVVPQYIKKHFPDAIIGWVVEPLCFPLVSLNPHVDTIITFERKKGLRDLRRLRREMRAFKPDITLDLQRHFKSGFFSWLSGASRRIGFHSNNAKEFNQLFNNEHIEEVSDSLPKLEHYLLFLKKLEIPFEKSAHVELRPAVLNPELRQQLHKRPVVLIVGSNWDSKDWPLSGYASVIKQIKEYADSSVILLIGTKKQFAFAERLVSHNVINLCGQTSLGELPEILKHAQVVIGPDSGPGHIAAMVGTAYVSLFGPTSAERTAPYGFESLVITAEVPCRPCYRRTCPGLDKVCMRLIAPERVVEISSRYLEKPQRS